jgi:hypothetical protein
MNWKSCIDSYIGYSTHVLQHTHTTIWLGEICIVSDRFTNRRLYKLHLNQSRKHMYEVGSDQDRLTKGLSALYYHLLSLTTPNYWKQGHVDPGTTIASHSMWHILYSKWTVERIANMLRPCITHYAVGQQTLTGFSIVTCYCCTGPSACVACNGVGISVRAMVWFVRVVTEKMACSKG